MNHLDILTLQETRGLYGKTENPDEFQDKPARRRANQVMNSGACMFIFFDGLPVSIHQFGSHTVIMHELSLPAHQRHPDRQIAELGNKILKKQLRAAPGFGYVANEADTAAVICSLPLQTVAFDQGP